MYCRYMDLKKRISVKENKKPSLTAIKTTSKDKNLPEQYIITLPSYLYTREALRKLNMQLEIPSCLGPGPTSFNSVSNWHCYQLMSN